MYGSNEAIITTTVGVQLAGFAFNPSFTTTGELIRLKRKKGGEADVAAPPFLLFRMILEGPL
jgi:hypothetical protein